MDKKVQIAGLTLDNCSATEAVNNLQNSIEKNNMFTVAQIDTDIVMAAAAKHRIKEAVHKINQTVIADWALLKAVNLDMPGRKEEIENSDFFFELMEQMNQKEISLVLLTKSVQICKEFQEGIQEQFPQIRIAGAVAMDRIEGAIDAVLNDMNALAPDMILNVMPSIEMIEFFDEHRDKIFVKLWYGMGERMPGRKEPFWKGLHVNRKKIRNLRKCMKEN